MCNIGMFISAVYGIVRFGDDFTLYIGVGAILLLGAVILSTPNAKAEANGGFVWFAVALASGLSNGAVASVKREAVAAYSGGSQIFFFGDSFLRHSHRQYCYYSPTSDVGRCA